MRAIIVEDEQQGMQNLVLKLQKNCPEVEIVVKCESGESAVRAIREHNPDLLFLDIQLGTMTGFDVLDKVQHIPFEVIFTTAYDEYAIRAIRHSAVDYLLKPVRPSELKKAVDLAAERIQTSGPTSRILLPDGNGYQVISTADITYCLADNVNTVIHRTSEKPFLVVKTLKAIYSMLPKDQFHRISRAAIINLDFVTSFHRTEGGYVIMKNKEEHRVTKTRVDDFLRKLGKRY